MLPISSSDSQAKSLIYKVRETFPLRLVYFSTTLLAFFLIVVSSTSSFGQTSESYNTEKTRILFLLDGSGSMKEKWEGRTMFNIAQELLTNIVDSVNNGNSNVEFGLRVYGHQYPREAKNCKDSKLEVPFHEGKAASISKTLQEVTPQGWTPIAYSLFKAAQDFPDTKQGVKNAIILITDGLETCDGDPCAAGRLLRKKRISVKPFVIGLGLGKDKDRYFDCVGDYYDVSNRKGFQEALDVVVSQSLSNTTTQVNLLDRNNEPTITDVPMTFYDAYSGRVLYNFIHTLQENGKPDTLLLDPTGKYNLTVHTTPPLQKKGIELNPGTHNIIGLKASKGNLTLNEKHNRGESFIRSVIKDQNNNIINVQDLNKTRDYLNNDYNIQILTLPWQVRQGLAIEENKPQEIVVKEPGTLTLLTDELLILSIYQVTNENWQKIYEFRPLKGRQTLEIQPGQYKVIYRQKDASQAETTEVRTLNMEEGGNELISF